MSTTNKREVTVVGRRLLELTSCVPVLYRLPTDETPTLLRPWAEFHLAYKPTKLGITI